MLKKSLNLKYAHESIELAQENKREKSCGKSQPLMKKRPQQGYFLEHLWAYLILQLKLILHDG